MNVLEMKILSYESLIKKAAMDGKFELHIPGTVLYDIINDLRNKGFTVTENVYNSKDCISYTVVTR